MPKPDEEAIRRWVTSLTPLFGGDKRREWWSQYAFRFDTLASAAAILKSGVLLSRQECTRRGIDHHDAANRSVIENSGYAHDLARLYFRPLTPTQYMMEGIKTASEIPPTGEHCPVPVFLLFDLVSTLAADGVKVTDGSMANAGRYRIGEDAEFLRTMPMNLVYHDGPYESPPGKDELKFRRQAEIVRECELSLNTLRIVVCRTGAERDTLLHLLGDAAEAWAARVRIVPVGRGLFYRERGFHVREVRLSPGIVHFTVFRRDFLYRVHLRITDADSGRVLYDKGGKGHVLDRFQRTIPGAPERVEVVLMVEGCTAFHGIVTCQRVFS